MKYYLSFDYKKSELQDKQDRYIPINWETINCCNNANDLINICNFTMQFHDKGELLLYLLQNKIISPNSINKDIVIMYKYNKEYKHLRYGITYNDDKKFLIPDRLGMELLTKRNDYDFLKRLINNYRNVFPVMAITNELLVYVNDMTYTGHSNINYDLLMEEFVNRIIYKYDSKSKSLATDKNGVLIVDPRQLRDLAMFVVYQNNKVKEITKESFKEQTRQFDTNTKKLTRKLPEYEQMTLFEK
jgi:hypothetical protein